MGKSLNKKNPINHGSENSAPVSKTASGESGQNDGGLERGKGLENFAEEWAWCGEAWAKYSSPWFCPVAGAKAMSAKKPFC
ncbi:hypothetical protein EWM62_08455 [Mucilaginibacter terrigena]|uniref:Uncharacterized protein n=1 Tax=Mucilaginibacter terrigena TaxID=2492395 RepID=A0A4Q5LLP3_9SPHI|nr:hypothetical protein [Mucilaginibacter terrigena]RYU90671.1 hypothetical protein EWM62_08455 [Mucilaginibacter terrigena]